MSGALATLPSMSGSNLRSFGGGTAKCSVGFKRFLWESELELVQHDWTGCHRSFGSAGYCQLGFCWRWVARFIFRSGVLISEKVFQYKRFLRLVEQVSKRTAKLSVTFRQSPHFRPGNLNVLSELSMWFIDKLSFIFNFYEMSGILYKTI